MFAGSAHGRAAGEVDKIRILLVRRAVAALHGLPEDGAPVEYEQLIELVHPARRAALDGAVRRSVEEGAGYELVFRRRGARCGTRARAGALLDAPPHRAVQRGPVVGMDQLDQLLVLDGRAVLRQAVQRRDALRPADAVLADLPPPRGRARPGQHQLQAGLALPQRLVVAGPPHGRGEHVGDALGERRVVGREGALALAVHAQHAEDVVLRADRDGQAAGDAAASISGGGSKRSSARRSSTTIGPPVSTT